MYKYFLSTLSILALPLAGAFAQSQMINGGSDHAVALCNKGQIFAWGWNKNNCLCLVEGADSIVASPSLVNTGSVTFSQVNAGSGSHSVALSCYGTVYCWGANEHGQCGQPASKYLEGGQPLPVKCGEAPGYNLDGTPVGEYLGGVKYVTATSAASIALLDDGTCVVWGGNNDALMGQLLETESETPLYVRDADGNVLKNIIFVAGGDNGIMFIVGETADAKVGTLYSIGTWNGRGGGINAKATVLAPVEIGDGTGTESSGKYLTNVRTCGYSDSGAFAVDAEGQIYAWGNNGWWGVCGLQMLYPALTILYAEKVTSGEYKEMSGDDYLTDAVQVIGGSGSGTVLTKEGYVLYWGSNTGAKKGGHSGGTIPNSDYSTKQNTQNFGPVFANYCAGEHGNETETRIDDAVAIGRGDLMGFVIDKAGDFYVWGTTQTPGGDDDIGTLGTGNVAEISTCLKKIDMPCAVSDLYPEAYMVGPRFKCPGARDTLNCGFIPFYGTEDNYFYRWSKDGVVLNTNSNSGQKTDVYNQPSIVVTEPGVYSVEIIYEGMNVPCDNVNSATAEVEVIDYTMPIDTIIPTLTYGPNENVLYASFTVNDLVYGKGENTTWNIYGSEYGDDLLKTVDVKVGETFAEYLYEAKADINSDTTINLWIEDATRLRDYLIENVANGKIEGSKDDYESINLSDCSYLTFVANSDVALGTFNMVLMPVSPNESTDFSVKAAVYNTEVAVNGMLSYLPIEESKIAETSVEGLAQAGQEQIVTLDFGDVVLPAKSKGTVYMIVVTVKSNHQLKALVQTVKNDTALGGNVTLIDGGRDYHSFPESYSKNNHDFSIFNIELKALPAYSCERIPVSTNYVVSGLTSVATTQADATKLVDVYSVNGMCIRRQVPMEKAFNGLRKGAYVVNGNTYYVNNK